MRAAGLRGQIALHVQPADDRLQRTPQVPHALFGLHAAHEVLKDAMREVHVVRRQRVLAENLRQQVVARDAHLLGRRVAGHVDRDHAVLQDRVHLRRVVVRENRQAL